MKPTGVQDSSLPTGVAEQARTIYIYFEEIHQFAKIQLYDSITRDFIRNAKVTLFSGDFTLGQTESDLMGITEFRLSPVREYKLVISHKLYKPSEVELLPGQRSISQAAQIKIYLTPLQKSVTSTLFSRLQTRERTALTNTISFSSAPLDVDIANEVTSEPIDTASVAKDSVSIPHLEVIVVENVNDLPSIMVIKNDSIYDFILLSPFVLGNQELDLKINIPRGAKRNDYETIISEKIHFQGYGISRFLLIRSFFFDSEKILVRNDASAQLDKIIDVMVNYPQIDVELIFHSDSRGTELFNLELSKRRSEEVVAYLTRAGIKTERIVSQFVGESQLLNDCGDLSDCDDLLHQMNRTAEFNLIVRKEMKK